eukprot:719449_1
MYRNDLIPADEECFSDTQHPADEECFSDVEQPADEECFSDDQPPADESGIALKGDAEAKPSRFTIIEEEIENESLENVKINESDDSSETPDDIPDTVADSSQIEVANGNPAPPNIVTIHPDFIEFSTDQQSP